MNKHTYFHNELAEMLSDIRDAELIASYEAATWQEVLRYISRIEDDDFFEAVHFGDIFDKDAEPDHMAIQLSFSLDFDDFDTSVAIKSAKYSTEALHRKHRKSRRKSKVNRRKNSRWVAYLDGTAKECKHKNHRAVRREYDMPIGKSNFSHKVGCYEYFW